MEPHGSSKRPASRAEVRALAHPLRLRIIRLCLDGPLTNRQIAERLNEEAATVLYHVRTLERNGFLVRQAERRGRRGAREIPYLSTRKSISLDLGLASGVEAAMLEATRDEVIEAGSEAVLTMSRLGIRLPASRIDEFEARLESLVRDYAAAEDPQGEPVALMVLLHRRP